MLALWSYFWTETDWTGLPPAPTPAPADEPVERRGGGHKRENDRLGADYWDVRERYLRRYAEPLVKSIAKSVEIASVASTESDNSDRLAMRPRAQQDTYGAMILHQQALIAALQAAYSAQNVETLRNAVSRANQLHLDISKTQQQHYNSAIALLLLDAF